MRRTGARPGVQSTCRCMCRKPSAFFRIQSAARCGPRWYTVLPLTARAAEANVSQAGLASEVGHLLDIPGDLAGQMLSSLESLTTPRAPTATRLPGSPAQHVRRILPESPAVHDLPPGEVSALPENLAAEHGPVPATVADSTEHHEPQMPSPFSLLDAVPRVPQFVTSHQNPILGEALHRQERAVEALSLVTHRPAEIPTVHLPCAVTAVETASALAPHLPDELVPTFPTQFAPLHQAANLPTITLRTARMVEHGASSLGGALLPETRRSEALSIPEYVGPGHVGLELAGPEGAGQELSEPAHDSEEFIQPRHIAQASDRMLLNGISHARQPMLDLPHPSDTFASTFRAPSLQVLRNMVPAGAELGLASLASLTGLGHSEPLAELMQTAGDAQPRHELSGEHAGASSAAGSLPSTVHTTGEQFGSPLGRLNLGGLPGLSFLGRQPSHTDHPLALRPLPEIADFLTQGAEHVTQLPEQLPHQSSSQELLSPPRMEVRRDAHVPAALANAQSNANGFTGGQWSDQSGGEAC